jgi:hypothetical protein
VASTNYIDLCTRRRRQTLRCGVGGDSMGETSAEPIPPAPCCQVAPPCGDNGESLGVRSNSAPSPRSASCLARPCRWGGGFVGPGLPDSCRSRPRTQACPTPAARRCRSRQSPGRRSGGRCSLPRDKYGRQRQPRRSRSETLAEQGPGSRRPSPVCRTPQRMHHTREEKQRAKAQQVAVPRTAVVQ